MFVESLKSHWLLVVEFAALIIAELSGVIDIPYYAAAALASSTDYEKFAKVIIAIITCIMGFFCIKYSDKKYGGRWTIITVCLLTAFIILYFKSQSFNSHHTVNYSDYSKSLVVKGNHMLPEKEGMKKEIEKMKHEKIDEADFFAENAEINDSTGAKTAATLWPKEEIEANAQKIVLYYFLTVVTFGIAIISGVQILVCVLKKEAVTEGVEKKPVQLSGR